MRLPRRKRVLHRDLPSAQAGGKSDGAAIGKLVDTGAEVSFKNLLSAVRTGHVKGINVKINSEFGGLVEAIQKGVSIDSQIDSAYNQEILQKIREWGSKETGIPEILEQLKEPVTIQNITALQEINRDGMAPFKKIQAVREKFTSGTDGGESPEAADTLTGWTDVFSERRKPLQLTIPTRHLRIKPILRKAMRNCLPPTKKRRRSLLFPGKPIPWI